MRTSPELVRARSACVLLVLGLAWASRGYCPMKVAVATARQMADPHACCKNGLSEKPAGCCHSDWGANTAATLADGSAGSLPAPLFLATFLAAPIQSPAPRAPRFLISTHSPPLPLLRI